MEITIQKGDCLSKIAKKYYGRADKETINKIAQDNGITNVDLIYAGNTLKLNGLPENSASTDSFETESVDGEEQYLNKFDEITQKMQKYQQFIQTEAAMTALGPENSVQRVEFTPADNYVQFMKPDEFAQGNKVETYKNKILEIADEELEVYDTSGDEKLSYQEFEAQQTQYYNDTTNDIDAKTAMQIEINSLKDAFERYKNDGFIDSNAFSNLQEILKTIEADETTYTDYQNSRGNRGYGFSMQLANEINLNGISPDIEQKIRDHLKSVGSDAIQISAPMFSSELLNQFAKLDLNSDNYIDKQELAAQYIFMDYDASDINTDTKHTIGLIKQGADTNNLKREDFEATLDGTIDTTKDVSFVSKIGLQKLYDQFFG